VIIVIDGYNLLKQVLHSGIINDYERDRFIRQLSRYVRKKNHKVILVFDAGPFDRSTKEHFDSVCVVYSGLQMTADDYIREYVERNKGADMLLVTSDRELRLHARQASVESMPPDEFYDLIRSTLAAEKNASKYSSKTELIKTTESTNPELDALMLDVIGPIPYKKEDILPSEQKDLQTKSKKERKLLRQIKKL
jgi:predicted RNA-binding protein with PIN domain